MDTELTSNCCGAAQWNESDRCSDCLEMAEFIKE